MNQRVRQNMTTVISTFEADDEAKVVDGRVPTNLATRFAPYSALVRRSPPVASLRQPASALAGSAQGADHKEQITRLRGQTVEVAGRPAGPAADASKDVIVRPLRQRVSTLDNERRLLLARVDELQQRIEVLCGELYAKRIDMPHAIADSTAPRSTLVNMLAT